MLYLKSTRMYNSYSFSVYFTDFLLLMFNYFCNNSIYNQK